MNKYTLLDNKNHYKNTYLAHIFKISETIAQYFNNNGVLYLCYKE